VEKLEQKTQKDAAGEGILETVAVTIVVGELTASAEVA
jgi:hypothetical protein